LTPESEQVEEEEERDGTHADHGCSQGSAREEHHVGTKEHEQDEEAPEQCHIHEGREGRARPDPQAPGQHEKEKPRSVIGEGYLAMGGYRH